MVQALANYMVFKAKVTHTNYHTVHKVPHGPFGVHVICVYVINSKAKANTYPQGQGSPLGPST